MQGLVTRAYTYGENYIFKKLNIKNKFLFSQPKLKIPCTPSPKYIKY